MINMICPLDQTTLVIAERQGIEIDYCPKCRGVWLDRGELDKVIERVEPTAPPAAAPPAYREEPRHGYDEHRRYEDDDDRHRYGSHDGRHHKKHKREGLLGNLFDF